MTIALVLTNVIAYLLAIRHGGSFFGGPSTAVSVHYGAIPYELTHAGSHCDVQTVQEGETLVQSVGCHPGAAQEAQPETWETVPTSMFMHGSFLHIFGNMVFLAIFGPNVEDAMPRPLFLVFYLLAGLIALAAQVAVDPNSSGPTLGASGAIAGVLGGYILLYPRARVLTLVFIVFFVTILELPALVLLGFWFLEQLYFGLAGLANPIGGEGVAYFAHIGGFAFGLLTIRAFVRNRPPPRPLGA